MKQLFLFSFLCLFLFSCFDDSKNSTKKEPPKKEFLNHEILNDSIHYKIKEYTKANDVYRNLCVFNKETLLGEQLIYKVKKKSILDEGYNVSKKKVYEFSSKNTLQVVDLNFHYYDYQIESVDTVVTSVIVTSKGEITLIKNAR